MGGIEENDGSLVGRRLFVLSVGENHAQRRVGSAIGGAHAELPKTALACCSARCHSRKAEELEHQCGGFRSRDLISEPGEMAAGDMAALMRYHADDLIGGLRIHYGTGMDEHVVPVDDEGVKGSVVDDMNVDRLSAQACGVEDRLGVGLDQAFRLGITDHAPGVSCGRADNG